MNRFTRRQFSTCALAGAALPLLKGCGVGTPQPAAETYTVGVTGAGGRLGRLVVKALQRTLPPQQIIALARNTDEDTSDHVASGVTVRFADYDFPEQLLEGFQGVDRLLLVSSGGRNRVAQHQAVIDAARERGVKFMAYTSFLRADTSPMAVRADHFATEQLLAASGLEWAVLRNGWYTENYEAEAANALKTGEVVAASGEGRISPATRADYADAAAAVLVDTGRVSGQIHELGGDTSFTMGEFAAEVARQSGKEVAYRNLSEAEYRALLASRGMPEGAAAGMVASQAAIAQGALFDDSRELSRLIGRPTTPWQEIVAAVVQQQSGQAG